MNKIWSLFTRKQDSLGSAAVVLMAMVICSGLLGLIRYRLLNDRFTPEETGVLIAAFRLPNLMFELLAMGSLTSAFIPIFTKYIALGKTEEAYKMAGVVINITVIVLTVITIPVVIWALPISRLLAPGFSESQIELMASYTRYMMLFQVLPLVIGNYFTGILQSYKLFLFPALAPVVYNLGMILGIVLFAPSFGLYSAVIGVGIGAFLFMIVQLPIIIHVGYRHHSSINIKQPGVIEVSKLIVPRMIGLGASQIDVTIDLMMASLLGSKMVTVFFLAQNLQQIPVRLFGFTISQAALPTLSTASAVKDISQFKKSILSAFHMILFLVFPASALFIVLRIPVVRLVYGASRYDWQATVLTALTLSFFSISIFAQAISQVFTRGFYALYDSKTPVTASIITIAINSILSIIFVYVLKMPVWSLALSTTIASFMNAIILIYILNKKIGGFDRRELIIEPFKIFICTLISGLMIFIPMKLLDQLVFDTTRVFGLLILSSITSAIGLFSYLFLCWVFEIDEIQSIFRLFERVKRMRTLFIEPAREIISDDFPKS